MPDETDSPDPNPAAPLAPAANDRPAPKPWRPVSGLDERPSRMAFSDRLFFWFVYLGALAMIAGGVCYIAFSPLPFGRRYALALIGLGVGLFAFGGPSASQEKGYRE